MLVHRRGRHRRGIQVHPFRRQGSAIKVVFRRRQSRAPSQQEWNRLH